MVALGTEIAGLFTPSDVASTKVAAAARAAGVLCHSAHQLVTT